MKYKTELQVSFIRPTKVIRGTFVVLLFLFSVLNYGQQQQEDLLGSWFVISGNNKISNRISIPTIGILRHYKLFENYEFAFFRTGLTYQLDKNFYITGGAAYLNSEAYISNEFSAPTQQFWIYEELVLLSNLKNTAISNRLRFETRWIDKTEGTILNNRFRYRLQGKYSLSDTYYLKAFNELFINLERPHFNQNRFFFGLGYSFSKSLQMDIGYLKNHFKVAHYDRIRIEVYFKTNFAKSKNMQN